MTNVPDEMLMAYADNELSPREREQVEARLRVDAELEDPSRALRDYWFVACGFLQ